MTNNLIKNIRFIYYTSLATNLIFIISFFVGDAIGFNSIFTYFAFAFDLAISIFSGYLLIKTIKQDREFKNKVITAKNIIRTRNAILKKFYEMNNIPLMYDKKGNIRDLDSLLGIKKEYDSQGRLLPTIYDLMMLSPMFDINGKEIPLVLVIKHYVDKIRQGDFDKIAMPMHFIRKTDEKSIEHEKARAVAIKKVLSKSSKTKTPELAEPKTLKYGKVKGNDKIIDLSKINEESNKPSPSSALRNNQGEMGQTTNNPQTNQNTNSGQTNNNQTTTTTPYDSTSIYDSIRSGQNQPNNTDSGSVRSGVSSNSREYEPE